VRGRRRAAESPWERAGAVTLDGYRQVLARRRAGRRGR
jgi:hypothetical protein